MLLIGLLLGNKYLALVSLLVGKRGLILLYKRIKAINYLALLLILLLLLRNSHSSLTVVIIITRGY